MKKTALIILGMIVPFLFGFYMNKTELPPNELGDDGLNLQLGAFSISMAVKDLKTSQDFYQRLGFKEIGGALEQNYLIMKNDVAVIGLFQGMFEGHILTFNPGWNQEGKNVDQFMDIRDIQTLLKAREFDLDSEVAADTEGPGSIMMKDPDGNVILLDQHR